MAEVKPADKPDVKEKAKNTRTGPNPAHTLLNSIRDALAAGVPADKIVPVIDMARNAVSVSQAPVWRSCASTLDEYAKNASGPAEPF